MYEYTMLSAMLHDGTARNDAVFEAFARRLPEGRRFGLLGGTQRLLPLLQEFRFDEPTIGFLRECGAISDAAADYLADFRFTGEVRGLPEGSVYWPGTPVLTVEGELGQCVLLETLVLSVLNHDSAIASAAARMVIAAQGRPIIEMGGRRVHEEAAVAVARAAYLAGFGSTSNLEAGRRFGIPVAGTAAHASVLARRSEREAFAAQVATSGPGTTILVDTYDIAEGIRTAIDVAGPQLAGVRIDSGDLLVEATRARALLDELGATDTQISVTSDLDEYLMEHLQGAPIDRYGAGTRVATGSGHPTAGMVYKLVAVSDEPGGPRRSVAKASSSKRSVGGEKSVFRFPDGREVWTTDGTVPTGAEPVQVPLLRGGDAVGAEDLATVRERVARELAQLPAVARRISAGTALRNSEEWDPAEEAE
ncbi:nicotinate phosphoribosyltransferase [Brachybacterium sp. EF45031]|nr:nicotinate phosphoribosyltransferase [Brachybacterium sillae]